MNPWSLKKEMCFEFMLTIIFLDVSSSLELAFASAKYIICSNISCRIKSEGCNNFFNIKQRIMSSLILLYISLWEPYLSILMHFTANHHHFWYQAFDLVIRMAYVPFNPCFTTKVSVMNLSPTKTKVNVVVHHWCEILPKSMKSLFIWCSSSNESQHIFPCNFHVLNLINQNPKVWVASFLSIKRKH
jgi:hypothetical protein